MPRTAEDILKVAIGAQVFQLAALQARLEAAEAQVKELEAERDSAQKETKRP